MKIVIFGASGGTGRELVRQGLAQGHEVTAFVRNPQSMASQQGLGQAGLRVVQGDALDGKAVAAAVAGQEAVLSALGPRSLGDDTLLPGSMTHILAAMKEHGVGRLIVLGASGAEPGAERNLGVGTALLLKLVAATLLRKPFASQRAMHALIRASDREWTTVEPPRLVNQPGRGRWRVEAEALPRGGVRIARADVATFMLAQLTSQDRVRRSPFIAW